MSSDNLQFPRRCFLAGAASGLARVAMTALLSDEVRAAPRIDPSRLTGSCRPCGIFRPYAVQRLPQAFEAANDDEKKFQKCQRT